MGMPVTICDTVKKRKWVGWAVAGRAEKRVTPYGRLWQVNAVAHNPRASKK